MTIYAVVDTIDGYHIAFYLNERDARHRCDEENGRSDLYTVEEVVVLAEYVRP